MGKNHFYMEFSLRSVAVNAMPLTLVAFVQNLYKVENPNPFMFGWGHENAR